MGVVQEPSVREVPPSANAADAPIDLDASRHVTEPSRYALAVTTASLVLAILVFAFILAAGVVQSILSLLGLAGVLGVVWLLVQLRRIRLLGEAVKVSSATTPELQGAIEEVRARLDYHTRTDVYVTERTDVPIHLQSLLGTRVMVVKGEFVADLMDEGREAELVFLLATYFGALKARYDRLNLVLTVLGLVNVLRFVNPLLNPWYRATVYSGDQLAFLCCRDLRVSLAVAFRSLVGKEMAPRIRVSGVVDQARDVRRSKILRLSQLLSPVPHPTNRYLNLLAFAAQEVATQYADFLDDLTPEAATFLDEFRDGRRVTGGQARFVVAADLAACVLILAGAIGGVVAAQQLDPRTADSGTTGTTSTDDPTRESGTSGPTPTSSSEAFAAFVASLPYPFADTCVDATSTVTGLPASLRVAAACAPTVSDAPAAVYLYSFSVPLDAELTFDQLLQAAGATEGDCPTDAPARTTWSMDDAGAGLVGCYLEANTAWWVWTDSDAGVVTVAAGRPQQTLDKVQAWWQNLPVLTS